MATDSERTPLLSRPTIEPDQRSVSTSEDDDFEVVDEPVDLLLARYASHEASLGLSGSIGPFATTFVPRRGSLTFEHHPSASRRPSRASRYSFSQPFAEPVSSGTRSSSNRAYFDSTRRKSFESTHRKASHDSADVEEIEDVELASQANGKYLCDISDTAFWACFISIVMTGYVACFDSTLMASSHPVITSYFDASNAASWLSTSFLLTTTALQPLFGRVSDTFGRKMPLLLCLAAFLLGTIGCALARSIIQFILARAFCGLGAGGALSLGAIINSDLVPLDRRGSYLSLLNLAYGMGASMGAALGGVLADNLGWRWEFGIQVPAIFLCFVIACLTVPNDIGPNLAKTSSEPVWRIIKSFDLWGSFFLTLTITALILALNLGGSIFPWCHPIIIISFIAFFISLALLVYVESHALRPVLPLYLLSKPPVCYLILANLPVWMTMNTIIFNIPLFFQACLLDSPSQSGARLILAFVASMFASFFTGNFITWSKRIDLTLIGGISLIVLGSVVLTFLPLNLSGTLYSIVIATATMGQGFTFPSLSIGVLAVTDQDEVAVAMSTTILLRNVGTVMGVSMSSLVRENALGLFLNKFVTGADKETVIESVKKSVEVISTLEEKYRAQVIQAYAAALKLSFSQAIITAAIALALVCSVKLPRLTTQEIRPISDE